MISALLTHTSPPGITYLHFFGWNWYILIGDEQVLSASSLSLIIKHWFLITLSKMTPWYWQLVVGDQKWLPTIFCFYLDTLENKSLPKFKWVHVQEFELCVFLREVTVSCPLIFCFSSCVRFRHKSWSSNYFNSSNTIFKNMVLDLYSFLFCTQLHCLLHINFFHRFVLYLLKSKPLCIKKKKAYFLQLIASAT